MNIFQNPFCILGVEPRDDMMTILKAADDLYQEQRVSAYLKARDILTDPGQRLSAEISWFPGLHTVRILSILSCLHAQQEDRSAEIPNTSDFPDIAKLNIQITRLPHLIKTGNPELLSTVIMNADGLYRQVTADIDTVLHLINEDRICAGFPEVTIADVTKELDHLRTEIGKILDRRILELPIEDAVALATRLAEKRRAQLATVRSCILDDVFRSYEARMKDKINSLRTQLDSQRRTIESEYGTLQFDLALDGFTQTLRQWGRVVHPILMNASAAGRKHNAGREVSSALLELSAQYHT